jgi:predicted RNase H-like nuclease (RuvC/YqgF family)
MSEEMPLIAELSNCLSAYSETFQRVFTCIAAACDPNQKKHDAPITIQVHDLLCIDSELKKHLGRMQGWSERQEKIEELEKHLSELTSRVDEFATKLAKAQIRLQDYVKHAEELRRKVKDHHDLSPEEFFGKEAGNI